MPRGLGQRARDLQRAVATRLLLNLPDGKQDRDPDAPGRHPDGEDLVDACLGVEIWAKQGGLTDYMLAAARKPV